MTDADSRTDTITFFHQEITGDGRALRGDRLALLCFFHQEIAGDGRALRGDRLALLPWENRILLLFFINKFQVMDVLFKETDWLCSPGTSFAPLGESHGEGTNTQTVRHTLGHRNF